MPDTRTLLLEIGTEEIPASYLVPALRAFSNYLANLLWNNWFNFEEGPFRPVIFYTPRRLSLIIPNLPTHTRESNIEVQGPPAKVARDKKGEWTVAAKKFAESQGISEESLIIKENEKGSYVFVKKKTVVHPTEAILASRIPNYLRQFMTFPRSMKWPQGLDVSFARPVRWICCLFGGEVVEFEYAGLKSSNVTYGHRFDHPQTVTINHPDEYVQKLKDASVIIDPDDRRKLIKAELEKAAKELGGSLVEDKELLAEVTNLVEYPNVLSCDLGGFTDLGFANLPREVLQTALAKHQRAFVVEKKGKLLPHFLVVTNSPKLEPKLAKPWYECMAISRLEDADFFIKEDLDKGLEPLVEEEERVEWIKGLGSLADKTEWLTDLGLYLGENIKEFDAKIYKRAAHLAKADLLTNLVREKEFTSLQGIAGYIYAGGMRENDEVRRVIFEQYGDTPTSLESAVFGVVDRLLNIAATFTVGKPPKGSRDPFALRRQAATIMKIIIEHKLPINLPTALERTLGLMSKEEKEKDQVATFLTERLRLYLKDRGFAYDWVDAVLAVAGDEPYDSWLRISAFRELDKGEEFRLVAVGQKRVANITRNTPPDSPDPDIELFAQEEEKKLWEEANRIRPNLESAVTQRDYKRALELLLSIRPAIDSFFDEVFVMVKDEKVRTNRLNLVAAVRDEFLKVADFSRIVVEG